MSISMWQFHFCIHSTISCLETIIVEFSFFNVLSFIAVIITEFELKNMWSKNITKWFIFHDSIIYVDSLSMDFGWKFRISNDSFDNLTRTIETFTSIWLTIANSTIDKIQFNQQIFLLQSGEILSKS